ncbi:hypothetical protein Tco_0307515 [Tanacetum coccineum]
MSTDTYNDKPSAPNPQHENEEVSPEKYLDGWLKENMEKHMCGQDKESEEDALIDILKSLVGECKPVYTNKNLGASVNVMPKSIFEHLKLASLKETSIVVEMADMTKKDPLGIVENVLLQYMLRLMFSKENSLGIGEDRVKFDMDRVDTMLFMEKERMGYSNNGCAFGIMKDKVLEDDM